MYMGLAILPASQTLRASVNAFCIYILPLSALQVTHNVTFQVIDSM